MQLAEQGRQELLAKIRELNNEHEKALEGKDAEKDEAVKAENLKADELRKEMDEIKEARD